MDFLEIALIVLVVIAVWAVVELALTARSARRDIEKLATSANEAITSATQWFERTLDDSANKWLSVPEGFLAVDGILDLCLNVMAGFRASIITYLDREAIRSLRIGFLL